MKWDEIHFECSLFKLVPEIFMSCMKRVNDMFAVINKRFDSPEMKQLDAHIPQALNLHEYI